MNIKVVHRKLWKERADGLAWKGDRLVEIDPRLAGKRYMETVIHEIDHIAEPDWTEEQVEKHALILTNVLWKLGFRKCDLGGK